MKKIKAIALISGGLDSSLAIRLIQNQGIELIGVHFLIPFSKHDSASIEESSAKKIADQLGVKLRIEHLKEEFLEMIKNPKYGYGKNLNPCIDCKIFMLKKAKEIMKEEGASFIVTGEVLGQRPMSQNKAALAKIAKESQVQNLLLRPLSARFLPKTLAEEKGWVKKEELEGITGRGRNRQIELAKNFGIKKYPWPAGGCLLTEPSFCARLKDLIENQDWTVENIDLLKAGRYFRITPWLKLIVGRNKEDNEKIVRLAKKKDLVLSPKGVAGPTAIARGVFDQTHKKICAQIVARYSDVKDSANIEIVVVPNKKKEVIEVKAFSEADAQEFLIS
jgi:tRNA U34 2-thiouridine synthase MnmA/TrmU